MAPLTSLAALKTELREVFQDLSGFEASSASDSTALLVQKISDSVTRCSHLCRPAHIKRDSRSWIDGSVVRLSKLKKRLRSRLKRHPSDGSTLDRLALVERQLRERKRLLRDQFLACQFDASTGDSKSFWRGLNLLLGRVCKRLSPSRVAKCDGSGITANETEVSEEFNNFFCRNESQLEPRGSVRREWVRRSL